MRVIDAKGLRAGVRRARPIAEVLEQRQLLSTITVNTTGDADGADGSDTLSLRQAIEIANGTLTVSSLTPAQQSLVGPSASPDTIDFNITGAGPFTIAPATALPKITVPVVIDGYSQPGSRPSTGGPGQADNAVIRVGLSGAALPVATSSDTVISGLVLAGGGSTVQGLALFDFSSIYTGSVYFPAPGLHSGTIGLVTYTSEAILLQGQGGNLIRGNFVGLDPSGNPGAASNIIGIDDEISSGVGDTIGGTAASDRNVISGNATGVAASGHVLVQGNFIGTDPTGTRAILTNANQDSSHGISAAPTATIGGTAAGAGNLVSGNGTGISGGTVVLGNLIGTDITGTRALGNIVGVFGATALGGTDPGDGNVISGNTIGVEFTNLIEGNLIGTDITGTRALGNATGVLVNTPFFGGNTTIGGTSAGAGNVISGNANYGIYVLDYPGEANLIAGNFIGTDITGFHALPNDVGIDITAGNGNTVGGTVAGAGNLISGNHSTGVQIDSGNTGNLVQGNLIGVDASGKAPLPNGGDGVLVNGPNNLIGGTSAGAANVIADNGKSGVAIRLTNDVFGSITTPNSVTVSGNAIYANGGLGIDLGDDGITPNNPAGDPTGPNLLQPYPVLTSATPTPTGAVITGVLDALPSTPYVLEFFSNPAADPSGYGQGQIYLGTTVVTTDPTGHAAFAFTLAGSLSGASLSATATDPLGNTSEFARDFSAYSATTTTTLTLNPSTPTAGQPLTLLATITPAVPSGTPTGQVDFTVDGRTIGSANLDATGSAMLTIPAPAGSHIFQAIYAGSAGNPGSASDPVVATVANTSTTTTTLIGPSTGSVFGRAVAFAALVAPATPGGPMPTGTVVFAENGVILGEAPVDASGFAVFITNSLPVGPNVVAAVYLGDTSNAISLSNYVAAAIAPTRPLTRLIAANTPQKAGRPISFAVAVSPTVGDTTPTGIVAFAVDGILLGEAPLNASGVTVFITDLIPPGTHAVAAVYLGDTSNPISLSNNVPVKVLPAVTLAGKSSLPVPSKHKPR